MEAPETAEATGGVDLASRRSRVRRAASVVFTERGIDAPMPAVAEAAGVGIGSLYRCYAAKEDLVAALVLERFETMRGQIADAADEPDPAEALRATIRSIVDRQATDRVLGAALAATSDRQDVREAIDVTTAAWADLLNAARAEGAVRDDATTMDIRLLFSATRAAQGLGPDERRRMLRLMFDALGL